MSPKGYSILGEDLLMARSKPMLGRRRDLSMGVSGSKGHLSKVMTHGRQTVSRQQGKICGRCVSSLKEH